MDFPYYPADANYLIESMMVGMIIGLVIGLAFAFVFYIFNALGLYKISKNRGYKNAWLAFVPVVNSFVLGGIADNINACYMKKSNHRIWLIVLKLITCALYFVYIAILISTVARFMQEALVYGIEPNPSAFAPMMLIGLLMGTVGIASFVFTCICWYKVFADYSPNNATLFLVLSILFGIAPFFIFAIRNKPSASLYYANQRMNPPQPQYQPQQQAPQYQQPVATQQPLSAEIPTQEPVIQPQESAPDVDLVDKKDNDNNIV
ncbi:MAG: hypothetical protein WAX04_11275 [Oscillospiraceae bacterium]